MLRDPRQWDPELVAFSPHSWDHEHHCVVGFAHVLVVSRQGYLSEEGDPAEKDSDWGTNGERLCLS